MVKKKKEKEKKIFTFDNTRGKNKYTHIIYYDAELT